MPDSNANAFADLSIFISNSHRDSVSFLMLGIKCPLYGCKIYDVLFLFVSVSLIDEQIPNDLETADYQPDEQIPTVQETADDQPLVNA